MCKKNSEKWIKEYLATLGGLTYSQFAVYTPLCILLVVDQKELNPLMIYPLQVLNVFELLYCILLVFFFRQEIGLSIRSNYKVVLGSHQASLAARGDKILLLEDGKNKGMGSHEELLTFDNAYSRIWNEVITPNS